MGYITIIILTESSKFSGRCVAGIDINTGKWVRLVSSDENSHGAISIKDLICQDGQVCKVLDIVQVPIIKSCGTLIQPENVLIDDTKYITVLGKASLQDVLNIHPAETKENILGNIYSYITEQRVYNVGYSLTLVKVSNAQIHQTTTPEGKNKTKISFSYKGTLYKMLPVTDPNFYSVQDKTVYTNATLVISIGTPYNNNYYKFVSGIFV